MASDSPWSGTRLYPLLVPGDFPALLRHVTIDARVLTFALAISVLSSVVFGLLPRCGRHGWT